VVLADKKRCLTFKKNVCFDLKFQFFSLFEVIWHILHNYLVYLVNMNLGSLIVFL